MPCDTRIPVNMTRPQRRKQIDDSIAALKKALAEKAVDKKVTVKISPTGAIAFVGPWQRNGVSDVCAYRKLQAAGSPELREAIARAQVTAGRKIDPMQIAAGVHSHDGGNA